MQAPKLDPRSYNKIVKQAVELAKNYIPEWASIKEPIAKNDPGYRMIEIFARLMEILFERLNKIPDKNFLSFLDMVGVEQQVGSRAEVPVTFLLSKSAQAGGEIPEGIQVATTQTDTADAQVFETRKTFYVNPANLRKVINLIPDKNKHSELELIDLPPKLEDLEDESGTITALSEDPDSLQHIDHILYVGSEVLFGRKETVKIALSFTVKSGMKDIFDEDYLEWKKYSKKEKDWKKISAVSYGEEDPSEVTFDFFDGTDKYEVNGKEDYWIACHFIGEFATEIQVPDITGITGEVSPPGTDIAIVSRIESAFSNSNPIDLTKSFYPFGECPKYGDAFYIGSKEAFSPEVESVTLKFTILAYNNAKLLDIFKNIKEETDVITSIDWEYLDENKNWQLLAEFKHTLTITSDGTTSETISHELETTIDGEKTVTSGGSLQDGTLFGTGNSNDISVDLNIPDDIDIKELNQQENYWIRAIIRSEDPYGKEASFESKNNSFVIIGPTFIPPIVEKVEISYTYKPKSIPIDSIQTKNNFEFVDYTEKLKRARQEEKEFSFTPFVPITSHPVGKNKNFFSKNPVLYLGFDRAFGDVPISMFVHLKDVISEAIFPLEKGNPRITWEYVASEQSGITTDYLWKPLDVEDGTADLTSSGTVAFTGPSDSEKVAIFGLLFEDSDKQSEALYWYRARLADGKYDYPPQVKSIYLNTVMADNGSTSREDQVIGSGTGSANLRLTLTRTPLLGGEVWVREPEMPSEEELKNHQEDLIRPLEEKDMNDIKVEDLIKTKEATEAGEEETWILWLKVPNFLSSGPRSRHYTLDSIKGEITFGNGEKGLIPPAGKDNIIISNYCTGGGEEANNVATPMSVKELKSSFSYVDKVFNVQNAVGGSDSWSLKKSMEFGPQSIKNRDRAVTVEDYEWMTLQQFSQVARAKCIPTRTPKEGEGLTFKPGAVTVIIVPKSSDRKPQPSKGLLKIIKNYLIKKALGNIFKEIHVIGAAYKEINVKVVVVPSSPEESSIVERRIVKELEAFFHPLTGGEWGEGWEFGRNVYKSEVCAVIERTEGVNHVKTVEFIGEPDKEFIEVDDNSLVTSGSHEIGMETE